MNLTIDCLNKHTNIYQPSIREIEKLDPESIAYQISWKFALRRKSNSNKKNHKSVKIIEESNNSEEREEQKHYTSIDNNTLNDKVNTKKINKKSKAKHINIIVNKGTEFAK